MVTMDALTGLDIYPKILHNAIIGIPGVSDQVLAFDSEFLCTW